MKKSMINKNDDRDYLKIVRTALRNNEKVNY